ncbi:MAG: alanine racemase [Desulfobacteria bacterium]
MIFVSGQIFVDPTNGGMLKGDIKEEGGLYQAMNIEQVNTPAFLVDLSKVTRNTQRMFDRARRLNVRLRPHVKTHKTAEVARLQVGAGSAAITVSTLAEAWFFQSAGFDDITYAYPITPQKLPEAAELTRAMRHFHIVLDNPETFAAVHSYGRAHGIRFSAFIKVDCGYHRAGVDPEKAESITLAKQLHDSEAVEFAGILTHAGHSYRCRNRSEILEVATQERAVMVRFAGLLEENGVACPTVSVGSTPTAVHAESWEGVSEIRPGNYVFFDKFQADIGSCSLDDCAATVLTRVIGHYPDRSQLIIDAGALALSKDPGAIHIHNTVIFGAVLGNPQLKIVSLSQEHGVVESEVPIPFEEHPIGNLLRIIPNHSCLAAALFPKYYVVEEENVVDEWSPVRGW